MKQLCGTGKVATHDVRNALGPNMNFDTYDDKELSNEINRAFVGVMDDFSPLSDDVYVQMENDESISVTELCVMTKIKGIKASRASDPDGLPNWVLKEYAELFAAPVAEILNTSFKECMLPNVWKLADAPPLHKSSGISDFNKDLRPLISLTSTLSKVAESVVIEQELKPALLKIIDFNLYGFIPGSSTTITLISIHHNWLYSTDKPDSTVRAVFLHCDSRYYLYEIFMPYVFKMSIAIH